MEEKYYACRKCNSPLYDMLYIVGLKGQRAYRIKVEDMLYGREPKPDYSSFTEYIDEESDDHIMCSKCGARYDDFDDLIVNDLMEE